MEQAIKVKARELGFDVIGIASAANLMAAPAGKRPQDFLPGARSVISLGHSMNRGSLKGMPRTVNQYLMEYEAANHLLDQLCFQFVNWLDKRGIVSLPFGTSGPEEYKKNLAGDISSKHAAVQAGVGLFGLNNLLLTREFGPFARLVTVVTGAELTPDGPLDAAAQAQQKDFCAACQACVRTCPAGALDGGLEVYSPLTGWRVGKEKCFHYMFSYLGGKRCGQCIGVCPARPGASEEPV